MESDILIVGGGPAGMMAGLLFARAGLSVTVLEKHADFLRDFRGDTVHPSTLEIFHELGLLDAFLKRPHQRTERATLTLSGRTFQITDFQKLNVAAPYIAMMPQWDFLDFIAEKAKAFENFTLLQSCEATELLYDQDRVSGGRVMLDGKSVDIAADLTVACDGRGSRMRDQSGLSVLNLGAPIDVFWMRLPRKAGMESESMGRVNRHGVLILINRGDYWQCAMPLPKGSADIIRAQGIEAFRARIAAIAPSQNGVVSALKTWDDVKLLNVQVNRLQKWYQDGLLFIGDAAHAMSPVGGVGINLAVQDAVAAGRILGRGFGAGPVDTALLAAVQKRRERAARLTQSAQVFAHKRVLVPAITNDKPLSPPWPLKLVNAVPAMQGLSARMIGLGVQPEHWPHGL